MKHIVGFIWLIIFSAAAISQDKQIVAVRKYTQKDGLSSYNIRKIIRDKWGFMWVGTQDGLSRFDGESFINYTKNAPRKHKLCGTDVRELIEDSSNNLIWVLPADVGIQAISSITGEIVSSITIPRSTNDDWNISMLKSGDDLWIGTSTGIKIYNIITQTKGSVPALSGKANNAIDFAVRTILKDSYGNIWVCYDRYGIVIYDPLTKKAIKEIRLSELNDHLKSNEIRFVKYVALNGSVTFATNQGLRKISYSKNYVLSINNAPCDAYPLFNTESVDDIATGSHNEILVSGLNKLAKLNPALSNYVLLQEAAKISETDWLNAVQCINTDPENNLWLGCQEGLAFVSKESSPFIPYSYDNITNTKLDHVRSICPLPGGDILAGLRNGIVHIDHATGKYEKYDTSHLYYHIFQDKNGLVHISRPDGMFIFNKGKIIPIAKVYPEFSSYSSVTINSHLFINDSLVLLGSENNNGVLSWNPVQKTVRKIIQGTTGGLSSDIVNNIYRDRRQNTWVLSDNVISICSPDFKTVKKIVLTEKNTANAYNLFFDVCEAKGYYWLASYGTGILQLDSALNIISVISSQNGLSNEGVYQVYNLSDKSLLVTSNNGISVLDLNTHTCKNYFEADGLHSNGFEEVCGLEDKAVIYAGGVNGFTVIDPTKIVANKIPPVFYFKNVKLEFQNKTLDSSDLNLHAISIQPGWLSATISFIGLNYSNPGRVTYQYRIKELNSTWFNLGTQNFINLIGLNPGTYSLEVKAANENGYWSKTKTLVLVFEPKWYQTLAFKLMLLLITAGLLYALYRYRISQLKQQQLIRKNIASDLHDDIGSTLNTVKVFTHLAQKNVQRSEYLDEIENALTEATLGLRDMIWVLDDSLDTVNELLERIKKYALPVTTANGLTFTCRSKDLDYNLVLSKTEKRNLLLMAKEIINNSIKYADCKNIEVRFYMKKEHKTLTIKDDGKGFNYEEVARGMGLKNLFDRAEQIKYKVEINTSPGNGTFVKIVTK